MSANMKKAGTRSWRGDSGRKQSNSHIAGCEKCPDKVYKIILEMKRAREERTPNLQVGEGVASQILVGMHAVNIPGQPDWKRIHEDGSNHVEDLILEHDVTHHPLRASQPSISLHQDHAADNANVFQESMVRKASYHQASLLELSHWEMKQVADQKWAFAQEMTGMSFRAFVHPAFKEMYQFSSSIKGYKFPSEKKLRTVLLDTNYAKVKEATENRMWDNTVGRRGTMSCDGWTNVRGRALLNLVIVSRHGEMLVRHVDGSNTYKDSQWVADNIINEVEKVGPYNILQFTADNAPVNKLAGYLVRMRFPHIVFGGFATNIIMLDRAYGLSDSLRAMVADAHKDFIGRICFESMKAQETFLTRHKSLGLKSVLITCERSWSSYGQIHTPARNRLTMDRQEKLVYIYHNARINEVEIKKRRTATSLLSKFYTSRVQQQMLKKRHGEEYGASGEVNEAWVPTERLNVPQQYTNDGKAIPPPFDWEEHIDEDEVKDNMKTTMWTSKIPSQVTHFDDLNDEDFDGPSDNIYDESIDMEDLNETLASFLTGREWKQDNEGNEIKHVLTDSMATKYHIDSEKANELNEKFPHRRVPRVGLNCPEIIMEEVKFKMLKDLYGINRGSRPVQERKPVPKEKSRFASSSSQPSLKSCYDLKQRERLKLGITSYIDLNEPGVPMDDEKLNKLQRCYSTVPSDQKRSQGSDEMREEPTASTSGPKSHLNARPTSSILLHVKDRKGSDVEHRRLVGEFSGEENEIICTQPNSPTQSMSPGGSTRSLRQKETISYKEQLKGGPNPFCFVDLGAM
ncbi:hypothetical protein R1sor_013900 [Riccia sorocarpa]|uniref:DUF659 domain-containing protein n=1 Tax=Riccia sorocarpa TaxID=122646 RepID=A0ABD3H9R3_9MARC